MNFKLASVAAGVALLSAAGSAMAGDYDYGSAKDYGSAAVPVPAPMPLPMYEADWYVRIDGGYVISGGGDVTVEDVAREGLAPTPLWVGGLAGATVT